MMWARHLDMEGQFDIQKYCLTSCSHHALAPFHKPELLRTRSKWQSIIRLFDVLSHVIQPTCYERVRMKHQNQAVISYLVNKTETLAPVYWCWPCLSLLPMPSVLACHVQVPRLTLRWIE